VAALAGPGAHVQVGRVQVDVGDRDVVQRPGAEGADRLIELRADARDLGLADPRIGAERDHEVVHAARRDAVDVGLHHHHVERLVDAASGLEDAGKNEPLRSLGIRSSTSPAFVASSLGRVPLRSVTRSSVRS
jgi:hypothetical protein